MRRVPFAFLFLLAASAGAQRAPSIVGSWRLVSMTNPDSTGRQRPVWDDHPIGRIMYTADGQMAQEWGGSDTAVASARVLEFRRVG